MFRNSQHFKEVFKNWAGCQSDPMLVDYFYKKSIHTWWCDPPQYNYWFISCFALGFSGCLVLRNLLFNPDIHFRRQDARRNIVDRWQHHQYALPYFNSRIRNFALRFAPTIIDNEPDYAAEHPWGVRPRRTFHYARFPTHVMADKFFVDDPLFENCLHANVEKRYKAIGYYNNGNGEEGEEGAAGDDE